jgi:hypothetical protein
MGFILKHYFNAVWQSVVKKIVIMTNLIVSDYHRFLNVFLFVLYNDLLEPGK